MEYDGRQDEEASRDEDVDVNTGDDDEEMEKKEGATRMNFSDLKKAVEELSDPAKQKLTEMGLETFLKVKITSLHTRKGLLLLMLKSDVQTAGESFTTEVSEQRIYHITPYVVQQTFDFKNNGTFGADKLGEQKDHTSVFKDFVVELEENGFAVRKQRNEGKTRSDIDVPTLINYMKKIKENEGMTEQAKTEKLVFLFCCILVTKILLPTTSNYVVPRTVWMCSQENLLRNLNWCNLICLDIKNKIKAWQKKRTRMTATLAGCLVVPLINFLDSFLDENKREVIPRIVEYEDKEMERLIKRALAAVGCREELMPAYEAKANAQDNVGVGNNEKGKGRRKRSREAERTARQTRTQQEIVIRIPTINDLLKEAREDNWTFRGDDETLKNELTAELHEQREVLLDGLNRIQQQQEENVERFKKIVKQHSKNTLYRLIAEKASITVMRDFLLFLLM